MAREPHSCGPSSALMSGSSLPDSSRSSSADWARLLGEVNRSHEM